MKTFNLLFCISAVAALNLLLLLPAAGFSSLFAQQAGEGKTDQSFRSGYFIKTGIDLLPSSSESATTTRIQLVNGHAFNPSFSAGVGIGFTPYNEPLTLVPLFIDLNYRVTSGTTIPVIFLRAGYNFSVQHTDDILLDSHEGGLMLHPGVGLEFTLSGNAAVTLHAGYNIDNSSYQFQTWGNRTVVNDLSMRRAAVGFSFIISP
ncbi:MAG: hypothetical protein R6V27_00780 [Balneolaceae bacterium]